MTLRHDGGYYAIVSADIRGYRSHRGARYYNGNIIIIGLVVSGIVFVIKNKKNR